MKTLKDFEKVFDSIHWVNGTATASEVRKLREWKKEIELSLKDLKWGEEQNQSTALVMATTSSFREDLLIRAKARLDLINQLLG
jgi:hypothetical protein